MIGDVLRFLPDGSVRWWMMEEEEEEEWSSRRC